MHHVTATLEGALLDAAVALADGILILKDEPGWSKGEYRSLRKEYGGRHVVRWYAESGELGGWEPLDNQGSPSTDWSIGGPIIERERITMQASQAGDWRAFLGDGTTNACTTRRSTESMIQARGAAPLVAAMRAYVASKLGEEVELP